MTCEPGPAREPQEELISLPVRAWAHGTRVYDGAPCWLVTDGVAFRVQSKPGTAATHVAMLRPRDHAGEVHVGGAPSTVTLHELMRFSSVR